MLAPPVAALALPERWLPVLWWTPTYWPFAGFRAILEGGTTWGGLLVPLAGSLLTMGALSAMLYPWLKNKLDFARN